MKLWAVCSNEGMRSVVQLGEESLSQMRHISVTGSHASYKGPACSFIEYNGELEVHSSLMNMILRDEMPLSKNPALTGTSEMGGASGGGWSLFSVCIRYPVNASMGYHALRGFCYTPFARTN